MGITASQTDSGSPVYQTLMDDIRETLDNLSEGTVLLNRSGYSISNALVTTYQFDCATYGKAGDNTIIAAEMRIYIPVSLTKVSINICGSCSHTGVNNGLEVLVGTDSLLFTSMPSSPAWQTPAILDLTVNGWQDVTIRTYKNGGDNKAATCRGIIIVMAT